MRPEGAHRTARILRGVTTTYVLDGSRITTLEDFWRVVGESIGDDGYFGRNLDAFADCLRGGYGTPVTSATPRPPGSSTSGSRGATRRTGPP
jgi:hypothetical protein